MTRRKPVQQRSRDRVETILKTAAELLSEGGVEALTMRSLAAHTDIPVATIYRYFANREEIITAYLDHELEKIEAAVAAAVLALDVVTVRSLAEAIAVAHMRHHQAHPEGIPVWFGGRLNAAVLDRVRQLDSQLAVSLRSATQAAGMVEGAPSFSAELAVRLFDRGFEFAFVVERSAEEQEAIVLTVADMLATYFEHFATPAGLEGIPAEEFALAAAAGSPTPSNLSPAPGRL